jgi:hypothetical protein
MTASDGYATADRLAMSCAKFWSASPVDRDQRLDARILEQELELAALGPRGERHEHGPDRRDAEADLDPFGAVVEQQADAVVARMPSARSPLARSRCALAQLRVV